MNPHRPPLTRTVDRTRPAQAVQHSHTQPRRPGVAPSFRRNGVVGLVALVGLAAVPAVWSVLPARTERPEEDVAVVGARLDRYQELMNNATRLNDGLVADLVAGRVPLRTATDHLLAINQDRPEFPFALQIAHRRAGDLREAAARNLVHRVKNGLAEDASRRAVVLSRLAAEFRAMYPAAGLLDEAGDDAAAAPDACPAS